MQVLHHFWVQVGLCDGRLEGVVVGVPFFQLFYVLLRRE